MIITVLGINGRRFELWLSGRSESDGGMGVMVKELFEVVEVRMVSDRVMAIVLVFEEDVLRLICGYGLQSG